MKQQENLSTDDHTLPPAQFSAVEKEQFAQLVLSGGEVAAAGLAERIESAIRLTFMRTGSELIGVAALKQPAANYRRAVFEKAEASDPMENFPYELGWIVLKNEFRGKGLSTDLVSSALRPACGLGVYATVRLNNEPMRRTLIRSGFRPEGTHFQSERGHYRLALYVLDGKFEPRYLAPDFTARGQFHGSATNFPSFSSQGLKSLGFHFGDIAQALDFSKSSGFIHKVDLSFRRLINIESDWGWTSASHIAFALYSTFASRGQQIEISDLVPLLGQPPWEWARLKKGMGVSNDEQNLLCQLLRKYGYDGVRYINHFEPRVSLKRVAYFVIDPRQITTREVFESRVLADLMDG
ncbi:MAG TPA: GNAT family protein [Opitutaceae bacterium]|nr:GNAT family protein [Opitutaceae bacterium]